MGGKTPLIVLDDALTWNRCCCHRPGALGGIDRPALPPPPRAVVMWRRRPLPVSKVARHAIQVKDPASPASTSARSSMMKAVATVLRYIDIGKAEATFSEGGQQLARRRVYERLLRCSDRLWRRKDRLHHRAKGRSLAPSHRSSRSRTAKPSRRQSQPLRPVFAVYSTATLAASSATSIRSRPASARKLATVGGEAQVPVGGLQDAPASVDARQGTTMLDGSPSGGASTSTTGTSPHRVVQLGPIGTDRSRPKSGGPFVRWAPRDRGRRQSQGYTHALSFRYGQRHEAELQAAKDPARRGSRCRQITS